MSKKIFLNDPFERNRVKKFIGKKWSEAEERQAIAENNSVFSREIDSEERRRRLSYWFFTWLIFFMFMVSIFGIAVSLAGFAFKSPIFYAFIGILGLALFLQRTKRNGVKINIQLKNFPVPREGRRKRERRMKKEREKQNERDVENFFDGRGSEGGDKK